MGPKAIHSVLSRNKRLPLIYPLPQHSHLNQATAAHSTTEYIFVSLIIIMIHVYEALLLTTMETCNVIFYLTSTLNCCCCFFKLIDLVEKCVSFVMKQIVQYMIEGLSNHLFRMITANFLDYPYL